jgi:N-acetylneuraminate synthase
MNQELLPLIEQVRELVKKSHVVLPKNGEVKLYHHKGFDNFTNTGAVFIGVVVHDYCKFIVIMLPRQSYPLHFHRIKDESYFVLHGDLTVTVEEETHTLGKGEILNVPRRFNHSFYTENGCVFEEISTAYLNNDSVYDEVRLQKTPKHIKNTTLPVSVLEEEERLSENE